MRTLGSLLTFLLLVLSVHLTILRLNPGVADVRVAPASVVRTTAPASLPGSH